MKTKIIYISGNEIFDIRDIRAAFEEVRNALNLDHETLLFGVPVDMDDAGIMAQPTETKTLGKIPENIEHEPEPIQKIESETTPEPEIKHEIIEEADETPAPKKRGRPRKEPINFEDDDYTTNEPVIESVDEEKEEPEEQEKTIPILSVLSVNEETNESIETEETNSQIDIIPEISDEKIDDSQNTKPDDEIDTVPENVEPDLEKLLSEMTPLAEDIPDEKITQPITDEEPESDLSVDATLEQLATEFAENQDKIASETKSQSRSRIGKLRNILPFKQSKHKDQGIGDLLEWAGIAANDEDFSVPGFFTNVASKK